jgi:cardiolipin synthase
MRWKQIRRRAKDAIGTGSRRLRMLSLFILVAEILGVISAVDAVMNTRTSQGAIAWAVSLVTFPYVAVPAYWVLGRSRFHGYVQAHRLADLALDPAIAEAAAVVEQYRFQTSTGPAPASAAEQLARVPTLRGNAVELLVDGTETFDSIEEGIRSAEEYVLFQFFIVKDDGLGRRLQSALIDKAREGVRVYFLYDEIGSHALPRRYKDELREAGVLVYNFHTRQGPRNRFQINFRNHRKVVVVDGRAAWIGGHNVGDEYLGKSEKFGYWRDTHVRIDGPAAVAAQLSFVEDWNWATGEVLDVDWIPDPAPDGSDMPVLILPTGPADQFESAALMFTHAINTASERIWIASPYFVPDEGIMSALQLASLRGVDVRILIPDVADHMLVYLAAFTYFDEALEAGVEFYKYTGGFLHQKAVLIDDLAAAIGTANFDNRSFRLNFEITALVGDPGFVDEVDRMFESDFAQSRVVGPDEYRGRPFWFRLAARLARLTAPIQ